MARVQAWDKETFKKNLVKRLKSAKRYREHLEEQWRINERTVFNANSRDPEGVTISDDALIQLEQSDSQDSQAPDMAVNYAWRFIRYIHSQLSANPPSVLVRPTSTDGEDRLKADAADRLVRHGYSDKEVQELFDQMALKALTYGTAWIKCGWDPDAGDTYEFDDDTRELTMDGDLCVRSPSTWDIWIDPDAKSWREARYLFERIQMPVDEAKFKWGQDADELDKFMRKRSGTTDSAIDKRDELEEIVEVYYYVEKAAPINGMAGRMAYCLEDGTILGEPSANTNPGSVIGYTVLTDIDVPDQVYGKSFVEYIWRLQDLLNRLDTSFVDNIASHNVVRLILPEGAELEEQSLTNSAWDFVKITGNAGTAPYFAPPAQLMPDAHKLRENLVNGIQEMAGINESQLGQVNRELSGFAVQTAIEAGNTTRRRLFNKYTLAVRDFWKMYLAEVRENWKEERTILVLGKEKSFEAAEIAGADVDGGFDIVCEYGASLSLDPARRREEIMQLLPVFEKAGVPTKTILSMLKLNELEGLYDRMGMAADRQREIFDQMIATGKPVDPVDLQDHAGMLDFAYYYVMTATYKYLDDDMRDMIDKHIKMREQMAAQAATKGQTNPAAAAAGAAGAPVTAMPGAAPPQLPAPGVAPAA